jgi:hypothetical protein
MLIVEILSPVVCRLNFLVYFNVFIFYDYIPLPRSVKSFPPTYQSFCADISLPYVCLWTRCSQYQVIVP